MTTATRLSTVLNQLMNNKNIDGVTLSRSTGVPATTINRLRNGDPSNNPTLSTLVPIADYFEISVTELIGEQPITNPSRTKDEDMPRLSTIELFKENMKFSAAHFTVFSSDNRENLHGHNYTVYTAITTLINDEGFTFDYRFYKDKMRKICSSLNQTTIIAGQCKHLSILDKDEHYHVLFNNETLIFSKRDVTILPITNATVEELSNWILGQVLSDKQELEANKIQHIEIKVFSGPGQSGSTSWSKHNA